MRIDRLEAIHLRFAYAEPFQYAGGVCDARLTTLVQVHTDDGRIGLGSCYTHPMLAHLIVEHQLQPLLRGRDAADIESLWELMYRVTRWYGRKGAAMSALGAVDTALWDLRGRSLGKPLWQLLGGDSDRCAAYASALLWKQPERLAAESQSLLDRGFRRMKMRLGRGPDYDRPAVRAVRQVLGDHGDLMVDGSMRYAPAEAAELAEWLAIERVFWFEEPFPPEDLDDYAILRQKSPVPLAAGENEFGEQGFRELIRAQAVDIVQPDASRCGGISEVARVAKLAQQAGLRMAPHSWSDAVAIVANAHVVAASPCGITVEVDQTGNPFVEQLLETPLNVRDGHLTLSTAPGLGIRLNQKTVQQYRLADPIRWPDGCYSDMAFGTEFLS